MAYLPLPTVLLAGALLPGAGVAARGPELFALVVTSAEVRFEVRVPPQRSWDWDLPATPAHTVEHEWRVAYDDGILVLRVAGEASARRRFGTRPAITTVVWRVPGRPPAHRPIRITYVTPGAEQS